MREVTYDTACYGEYCERIPLKENLDCSDSRGSCNKVKTYIKYCYIEESDFWHGCPWDELTPCGAAPTPTPTPATTPTPRPSPTPTPCPAGSFDPDADGNCPIYANKINGCCACQERNTDCARFGQGEYCIWVESLCDCYNYLGRCSENPLPTPTPSGGGATYRGEYYADPGFYYGYYAYYDQCTVYVWVTYVSYDGGETWEETGEVEYAGCW